jgi:hypothetical protein
MPLARMLFVSGILLAAVSSAQAALAPNYQRIAELQAILDDRAVVDAFSVSQPIDRIEIITTDHYRVTAGSCHLDVAIVDIEDEPGRDGPRQFKVEIVDRTCPK